MSDAYAEGIGLDPPRSVGEDVAESFMVQQAGAYALERLLEMALVRSIAVPTPAVGAEWSIVVPGGVTWEVLAAEMRFTTSAVVNNRNPTLRYADADGNILGRFPGASNIVASVDTNVGYAAGLGFGVFLGAWVSSLASPPTVLQPASVVASVTNALDSGDQYRNIVLTVREWSPSRIAQRLRYLLADLDSAGGLV